MDDALPLLACQVPWGDPGSGCLFTPCAAVREPVTGDQAGELSEGQEAVVPASSDGRGSGGVPCGPEVQGPADAAKAGQVRQCSEGAGVLHAAEAAPSGPVRSRRKAGSKGAGSRAQREAAAEHRQPRRWSILTAEDHDWYLANQGESLRGAARERMEALSSRVAVEQQSFLEEQWKRGTSDRQRYSFVTQQAERQMQADADQRRQRVLAYPRLYRLHALMALPDPDAAAAERPVSMWHLQTLRSQPAAKEFTCPSYPQPLPLPLSNFPAHTATAEHPAEDRQGDGAEASKCAEASASPTAHVPSPADLSFKGQWQCDAGSASVRHCSGWKLPAPELSTDPILGEVAEQSDSSFQAAITASAFTTLMATLPTDQSSAWELPVQSTKLPAVPPSSSAAEGLRERVVLIDKPLQPRIMSLRQKHERLYKSAFIALATSNKKTVRAPLHGMAVPSVPADSLAIGDAVLGSPGIAVVDNDTRLRHTALPSAAMSRGTQYDLWGLGNYQLLIRSHETARAAFGQVLDSRESHPRPESTPVIVRTKMEYIPKQGLEQVTEIEMARWRAPMQLRADSVLMLARVAVHEGSLMKLERLRMKDVLAMCEDMYSPNYGYQLIAKLVSFMLRDVPEGRYMLVHPPGASVVMCFKALPNELQAPGMAGVPLPLAEHGVSPSDIYDLHIAHADSGATDHSCTPYIAPIWKQFNEGVPQIPYTFPVRLKGAPKRGGSMSVAAIAKDENRQRRRLRKLLPSAWNKLGVGGDWDSVGNAQVSREDSMKEYAQRITEDDD